MKSASAPLPDVAAKAARSPVTVAPDSPLWAVLAEVEAAHFRTQHDTGAHGSALLVWNALRSRLGLPQLKRQHLPAWDGKAYVMPEDSTLLANAAKQDATPQHCPDCAPEFDCWTDGSKCRKQPAFVDVEVIVRPIPYTGTGRHLGRKFAANGIRDDKAIAIALRTVADELTGKANATGK